MNSLAHALSLSRNGLILISSTVIMSSLAIGLTKAKPKPSCYMVNNFGEIVNLEDICDIKSQHPPKSNTATLVKNTEDVYLVSKI
ncbi:hypothetical protein [Pleurocapsa sp. PCC 7319]|uniref:hypothetical protein n=1 Tax=Pleurocapsa sp. PCC 7319 TaxID=118161 RepID=UPI00036D5980|nr:hypothetical protein [Pleurocapsa sp. PCC 7319]